MDISKTDLQNYLHHEIPLTKHMGLRVVECNTNHVRLSAPLDKNFNHKQSAFGGSLYSALVMSGWCLVHLLLKKHQLDGQIVIQNSQTHYALPVTGDIEAYCRIENHEAVERFITRYQRKNIARISLNSKVIYKNQLAASFSGQYVVHGHGK